MNWHIGILATHEEEQPLSTGPWLGDEFLGVALPCLGALKRWVEIRRTGSPSVSVVAQVMDVGPWCVDDDDYVLSALMRPRAEIYHGKPCPTRRGGPATATVMKKDGSSVPAPRSNGAGIDLFPATAEALKIPINHNVLVDWRFAEGSAVVS